MKGTIKSKRDVERLFQYGKRSSSSLVNVIYFQNPSNKVGISRCAFIAGKKLGNAPFRNRCKRVMREAFKEVGDIKPGFELVFIARKNIAFARHEKVVGEFFQLLSKAGVLKNEKA